ncbi:MAG: iron complex transport system permease protein [Halioglobus sp.]
MVQQLNSVKVSNRPLPLIPILLICLPIIGLIALSNGAVPLSFSETVGGLSDSISGKSDSQAAIIIGQIRLPRILLAAIVGAILACSGAAMQGLFRNPLADPSLIGVTAGASLGASIMIVSSGAVINGYTGLTLVSAGAFAGGLLSVLLVYRLATSPTGTSVSTMLLAGIAITALTGSLGNLLEFYSDNEMLRRISLWKMGGLDGADYPRLLVASLVGTVVLIVLPRFSIALNAMLLGESEARHLGIDVPKVKLGLIICVAVGVGTAVALAGTIAFVGLIVPHMVRMLTGPDHKILLPASALAGASLLLLADTIARLVVAPTELPVGVVTALIGVPFFISLLRKRHQYGMQ